MKKFLQILRDVDPQYYAANVRNLPEKYQHMTHRLKTIGSLLHRLTGLLTHSLAY